MVASVHTALANIALFSAIPKKLLLNAFTWHEMNTTKLKVKQHSFLSKSCRSYMGHNLAHGITQCGLCLLYTSPSPRD